MMKSLPRVRAMVGVCAVLAVIASFAVVQPASAASKKVSFDSNGVLKTGTDLTAAGGVNLDPISMHPNDYTWAYPITFSLLMLNADGSFSPGFASKVDTPDASTIVVTLRPNLVFSNGEKLDAQAAVNSIIRTRDSKNTAFRGPEMALLASATVESPTQFTLKLSSPAVGQYYPLLADAETAPVAPESIAVNDKTSRTVIAAGPFKIDSYTPGTELKLVKNDTFYDAKNVKLAGITYTQIAAAPGTGVTALKSGAVDYLPGLSFPDTQALTKPYTVLHNVTDAPYGMFMCPKAGSPLEKLEVRQALSYATDRNEINKKLYDGESAPSWQVFPADTPRGNPKLVEQYAYNPKKAKQLLVKAGYPDGFTLSVLEAAAGETTTIDSLVKQQWAKIGVTLEQKPTTNFAQDFIINKTADFFNAMMIRPDVTRISRFLLPTSALNPCRHVVPDIENLYAQLSALAPDDPARGPLWKQLGKAVNDDAWNVYTVQYIQSVPYNSDKVGGLSEKELLQSPIESWVFNPLKVYVKKGA